MISVSVHPALRGLIRLGVVLLHDVTVRESDDGLAAAGEALARDLRARHGEAASADVPGVAAARALYKALGIDPTKTRPSNEALTRRLLKGEPLYRVNTLVDALNLASVEHQLPFGLYDLDCVEGDVTLRRGAPGEGYEGIRKGRVNVGDRPTLVDAVGPFGNPTSDSLRTCIGLRTRNALVTGFAPQDASPGRVAEIMDRTAQLLQRWNGGRIEGRAVLP
jgi:DNA/RNA-binding domain of Phe-tRNA-synthetase-like protein